MISLEKLVLLVVVGQRMLPPPPHPTPPRRSTSQFLETMNVTLHGKRVWQVCFKLRILRGQMILDYPGRTNVITRVLIRGSQEVLSPKDRRQCDKRSRSLSDPTTGQEFGHLLEARIGKEWILP